MAGEQARTEPWWSEQPRVSANSLHTGRTQVLRDGKGWIQGNQKLAGKHRRQSFPASAWATRSQMKLHVACAFSPVRRYSSPFEMFVGTAQWCLSCEAECWYMLYLATALNSTRGVFGGCCRIGA